MFYPTDTIDELMPDILVFNEAPVNGVNSENRFGDFSKSRVETGDSFKPAATPSMDKAVATKPIWQTFRGNYRSLPESVLCHPSIGYSFRYGNVVLNGLDNSIVR